MKFQGMVENSKKVYEVTEEASPTELNKEIITSDLRSDTDEGPPSDIELFVAKNSMPDSNMVEDASEEAFLTEERSEFDGNNGTETERRKELVTWKCVHCLINVCSEQRLKAHMTNKHGKEAICGTCGFKTLRWDYFKKHLKKCACMEE